MRPSVFTYFDFRHFLKDMQKHLKRERPVFTLEYVGQQVGLKSKGHVSLIFSGGKTIPDEKIPAFVRTFGLDDKEAVFFTQLVKYNQAESFRERKRELDRLVALMRVKDKKLVPAQYRLCEKWYYPVVHEALRVAPVHDEWELLGSRLRPAITAEQAEDAVKVLREIGLLAQDHDGCWRPTDVALTFGEGWQSVVVREFQRHSFDLAQQALDSIPVGERDISSLTLSLGEGTVREIQERLRIFRQELLSLAKSEKSADRVVQVNLSLFPVTLSMAKESEVQ